MTSVVRSVAGVPIRLTSERWLHIVEHHDDLAGHYHEVLETVGDPDAVYDGDAGELLALSKSFGARALVVVYRESSGDGFVITAFFTTRIQQIERRRLVWTRLSS